MVLSAVAAHHLLSLFSNPCIAMFDIPQPRHTGFNPSPQLLQKDIVTGNKIFEEKDMSRHPISPADYQKVVAVVVVIRVLGLCQRNSAAHGGVN